MAVEERAYFQPLGVPAVQGFESDCFYKDNGLIYLEKQAAFAQDDPLANFWRAGEDLVEQIADVAALSRFDHDRNETTDARN